MAVAVLTPIVTVEVEGMGGGGDEGDIGLWYAIGSTAGGLDDNRRGISGDVEDQASARERVMVGEG